MSESISWPRDSLANLLHAPDAESAVIGALLISPDAYTDAKDAGLKPVHFHARHLGRLYDLAGQMIAAGQTPDPVSLAARAPDVTSTADLISLITDTPSAYNASTYAATVIEHANRRALVELAGETAKAAYARDVDPLRTASNLSRAADDLARSSLVARVATAGDAAAEFYEQVYEWATTRALPGLSTGFRALDVLGGLRRGELMVIAARPGMGKSSLAGTMSYTQARAGLRVSVCSLEMSKAAWMEQAILSRLSIEKASLDAKRDPAQLERVAEAASEAGALPMRFYEKGYCTADELELNVKLHARDLGGLDVIYLDHLGYVDHGAGKVGNVAFAIGITTKRLARLAKEYHCAVVALCQLNRMSETTQREPTLIDLRDSGEIEQDARQVWFLHRPQYRDLDRTQAQNTAPEECKVLIAKNNSGPTGVARLAYVRAYRRFGDLALDQQPPKAPAQRPANGAHKAAPVVAGSNLPY